MVGDESTEWVTAAVKAVKISLTMGSFSMNYLKIIFLHVSPDA